MVMHDDLPGLDGRPTELDRYDLGDAVGNDSLLAESLPQIATALNDLRSGIAKERTSELLEWVTGKYGKLVTWTKKGFAYLQSVLIKYALVEGRNAELISKGDINHAMADKLRAEADYVSAQAEAIRSETSIRERTADLDTADRKLKLMKKIRSSGIDFEALLDADGKMQIAYTKSPKHSETLLPEDESQN